MASLTWMSVMWMVFALAAPPSPSPETAARLVSFDELQERLGDPNLRLLDVRPRDDYDEGHIPGAIWVDIGEVRDLSGRPEGLGDRPRWQSWIEPLGIGPETEVLVYDANRQLDAARVWWLLTYLGVPHVGLIDGNFPLWAEQGRPVTTEVPEVEPRSFPVEFQHERHAPREEVLAALRNQTAQVLDARSLAEFTGEEKRSQRGGHIPTACHLEWTHMVDEQGRFLDESELRAMVTRSGIQPGATVISHCQGGGRASVNAFVLERLGFPTRNYYLGWSDWGNVEDTPIETESEPESS